MRDSVEALFQRKEFPVVRTKMRQWESNWIRFWKHFKPFYAILPLSQFHYLLNSLPICSTLSSHKPGVHLPGVANSFFSYSVRTNRSIPCIVDRSWHEKNSCPLANITTTKFKDNIRTLFLLVDEQSRLALKSFSVLEGHSACQCSANSGSLVIMFML